MNLNKTTDATKMRRTNQTTRLVVCLTCLLCVTGCDIGYKSEIGVLENGRIVDYSYKVHSRIKNPLAIIDGEMQRVSTWIVVYIDKNGKFGRCDYFTKIGVGSLKFNSEIVCRKSEELIFK